MEEQKPKSISDYAYLVGMTREEAQKASGMTIRAASIDGKTCFGTADFRTDRIKVSIRDDKIEEVKGFG